MLKAILLLKSLLFSTLRADLSMFFEFFLFRTYCSRIVDDFNLFLIHTTPYPRHRAILAANRGGVSFTNAAVVSTVMLKVKAVVLPQEPSNFCT